MTYTPDENYFGTDSFIYNVNVDGSSSTASVNIDIASVNDVPTFTDFVSTSSIDENTLVVLTVSVDDIENDPKGFLYLEVMLISYLYRHRAKLHLTLTRL